MVWAMHDPQSERKGRWVPPVSSMVPWRGCDMVQRVPGGARGLVGACCWSQDEVAPFGPDELSVLVRAFGTRRVAGGAPLMNEAEPIRAIGIVRDGHVELTRRQGARRVVLQVLHAGDVYGDIPLLCRMAPTHHARALTSAEVIELPPDAFWTLLATRPEVARRFLFSVASRLQRMQQRVLAVTSGDLLHQVAWLLLDETGGRPGMVGLTQATIAELLGAGRSNVNRVLKDLEARGIVGLGYRCVDLVDPRALRDLAA